MHGNGAEAAPDSFTRRIKRQAVAGRKSMVCDLGSEMTCHPELPRRWMTPRIATPTPPLGRLQGNRLQGNAWLCGSSHNTNGLGCLLMPKGSDTTQTSLNDGAALMKTPTGKPSDEAPAKGNEPSDQRLGLQFKLADWPEEAAAEGLYQVGWRQSAPFRAWPRNSLQRIGQVTRIVGEQVAGTGAASA